MRPGRDLREALRNVPIKGVSLAFERVCGLALVLVAAPRLGEAAFGRFAFASTVTVILAYGTDLGLGLWTTRALSRATGEEGQLVRVGLALRALAALPYALAVALVVARVAGAGERAALALLGVAALASAFVDHFAAVLRGRERFVEEALLNAGRASSTLVLGLGALVAGHGLPGLCGGLATANVVAFVAGAVTLAASGLLQGGGAREPDRALARRALQQSLPIWFAGLLSFMYFKVDTLFVRSLAGDAELGAYNAAYRIFEGSMMLPSILLSVTFPRLARTHFDPPAMRRLERSLGSLLAGLGAAVGASFFLGAPLIVHLVFGPQFARAAASLRVLALGVPLVYLNFGLTNFVIARDMSRWMPWLSLLMLALNVGLDLALIPGGGGPGAAWATGLSEVALTACCVGVLRSDAARPRSQPSAPAAPRTDHRAA